MTEFEEYLAAMAASAAAFSLKPITNAECLSRGTPVMSYCAHRSPERVFGLWHRAVVTDVQWTCPDRFSYKFSGSWEIHLCYQEGMRLGETCIVPI